MTKYTLTSEEQYARDAVEQRRAGFIACMSRVASPGEGGEEDTCECCGYPYLYYDRDDFDSCVICGWDPALSVESAEVDLVGSEINSSLAQAQANFENIQWCIGDAVREGSNQSHKTERARLVSALDALLADGDATNDKKHWIGIRAAFNTLARFVWPSPGRRLRYVWGFASLVDGAKSEN